MAIVYLSLGSNKGDRIGYVQQAASLLGADEGISIVRTSAFYESEPWNMNTKNWFVNAVVEIKTQYSEVKLRDLNNSMYKIENTENFIINDQGYLYLIYAYGNTEDTNKIDTIIFEQGDKIEKQSGANSAYIQPSCNITRKQSC